ncbi:MAG TPA: bile acid:sodium symporter [Gemmataceae bacterium]|jgi:BASS family bile acid:Na+ symporter|nr:bile acid:sodium symporter [Gemmataceae bacterium]
MTMDRFINIIVMVTLIEMMIAVGLRVTLADLIGVARNWRLVAQALVANYVCVPAIAVALLLLFQAPPLACAGFLILAVCPGAPFGPPCTGLAKGNVTASVGLMVILAGSSALLAPLLLALLLPWMAGDEPLQVDAGKIVSTLLMTQFVPLCLGLAVRYWRPGWADKLSKPANVASLALNLLAFGLILATKYSLLLEIRLRGYVGMTVLLATTFAVGWLFGERGSANRKAMTLTTSLRNVGVGLVIAMGAFAGTAAVTAVLVYGILEILGSLLLAFVWAQQAQRAKLPAAKKASPGDTKEPLEKAGVRRT